MNTNDTLKQKLEEEQLFRAAELRQLTAEQLNRFLEAGNDLFDFLMNSSILKAFPGCKSLDLGCGLGGYTYKLFAEGFDVTGADLSVEQVEFNNQRCIQNGMPNLFMQLDITNMEHIENESYDYVFLIQILHHIRRVDNVFKELFRILKPGGKIIIIEFNSRNIIRLLTACAISFDSYVSKNKLGISPHSNEGMHFLKTYKKQISKYGTFKLFPYTTKKYLENSKYRIFHNFCRKLALAPKYYVVDNCIIGEKPKSY